MFKKSVNIMVSMLLLVTTTGVHLNLHYSGNKLFSMSLFGEAKSCCDTKCNCCHESTINYQVKDDFTVTTPDHKIALTVLDLPLEFTHPASDFIGSQVDWEKQGLNQYKLPPDRPVSRSTLQVFLI